MSCAHRRSSAPVRFPVVGGTDCTDTLLTLHNRTGVQVVSTLTGLLQGWAGPITCGVPGLNKGSTGTCSGPRWCAQWVPGEGYLVQAPITARVVSARGCVPFDRTWEEAPQGAPPRPLTGARGGPVPRAGRPSFALGTCVCASRVSHGRRYSHCHNADQRERCGGRSASVVTDGGGAGSSAAGV
jgi:hypothetical protein